MQFNNFWFWIFFLIFFCVYYMARPAWRWGLLLVASMVFYSLLNAPQLIFALLLVTVISYAGGRNLASLPLKSNRRKILLWLGVLLNLAVMFFIRYLPFLFNDLPWEFGFLSGLPNLTVSVGVSFFVFQAISYLIDIYNGKQPAEYHFGYFALYLSFFPKLMQGPIERASNLLPQLRKPKVLDDATIHSALLLFAWGLFKKMVLADRLSVFVAAVYDHLNGYSGVPLWLATFYYALQIYFDFSGYSDMAIGLARLLGINLSINFNKPFLAVSIADFWRRWHISFSNWIFDYIFKPVQRTIGNFRGFGRLGRSILGIEPASKELVQAHPRLFKTLAAPAALLVTFFLSGIWHGASWGFVIWGLLHGFYMAMYALISPFEKQLLQKFRLEQSITVRVIRTGFTFLLVCLAWVFFRANTLADGWYVVSHLFSDLDTPLGNYLQVASGIPLVAIGILALAIVELPNTLAGTRAGQAFQNLLLFRWFVYWLLAMSILGLGAIVQTGFAYFRF